MTQCLSRGLYNRAPVTAKGWDKHTQAPSGWPECLVSFLTQAPIVAITPANSRPRIGSTGATSWAANKQVIPFVSSAAVATKFKFFNEQKSLTGAESRKSDRSDMSKTKEVHLPSPPKHRFRNERGGGLLHADHGSCQQQGAGCLVIAGLDLPLEDLCRRFLWLVWLPQLPLWFLQHGPETAAREQGSIGRLFKLRPASMQAREPHDWPAVELARGGSSQFGDFACRGSACVPVSPDEAVGDTDTCAGQPPLLTSSLFPSHDLTCITAQGTAPSFFRHSFHPPAAGKPLFGVDFTHLVDFRPVLSLLDAIPRGTRETPCSKSIALEETALG